MLPANFNQLYYFWTVGKRGSISAAAKSLLLNQSTLSLQMKQLEKALGIVLLSRGRRGVGLTGAGRQAFEYCDRMFNHAEELLALLKGGQPASTQVFRLGVSQTVSWRAAIAAIDRIQSAGQGVSVRIQSRSSEELQDRLERRMLDCVVSDLDLSVRMGREFWSRRVSSTPLFFVATPGLKKKMRAFPAGLAHIPLVLRSATNPIRKDVEDFLRRSGITPNVQAEVESPELIRLLAVQGGGAALMDPSALEAEIRQGRLVKLHKRPIGIQENIWFICRRGEREAAALQFAVDALMAKGLGTSV